MILSRCIDGKVREFNSVRERQSWEDGWIRGLIIAQRARGYDDRKIAAWLVKKNYLDVRRVTEMMG